MPMYNLLEYSDNYSMTSRSLWNFHRDEINADANENNPADSVTSEILRTPEVLGGNPVDATLATGATFQIINAKLNVTVVTHSINDNIKFLENIKQRFKRTTSWNKY